MALTPEEADLSRLIIKSLNLPGDPLQVDPEAPLYGGPLGLDSIDLLELSMVITKKYGVMLSGEGANKTEIFSCLRNLSNYVQNHQAD
ncbi:phosphopantetheine-binding protein [Acidithiobacillus ferriphilus]|jgi:acyl carrier protein|uniref:phosphopantetheine-binding protein n=1 Tax=Acidithiobacillus ferriphilus TaxID=1689834 RepID=UPI002330BA51|nr:phosphopantetheine-binding protein [Acidithiobacillus ferriphilus]WCE93636.1 phosphopantetheine-binding protein [Acidithiobacillus ferriphilus]